MRKTRDLFRKIRDTKGTLHKVGHNKEQKWHGPNRAIRYYQRQQEYTKELYKKDLQDPDNHNGVITHLEPDILACEMREIVQQFEHSLALPFFGTGMKTDFFQLFGHC